MATEFNCVLLIDDDQNCNLFHKRLFQKIEAAKTIQIAENGKKALEFLKSTDQQVDLILLDIDMPVMDGISFLEEYEKLSEGKKAKVLIIMVTSAYSPGDKAKVQSFPSVKAFKTKYLDQMELEKILLQFFPKLENDKRSTI